MKKLSSHHTGSDRRGSSLLLVILLIFALSLIVAGLLNAIVTEKRINHRVAIAGEARNAAEGAAEVAVAEINRRANSYSSLSSTPLSGFTFPDAVKTFLATGHVTSASIAFKGGNLSPLPTSPILINGSDPFNAPDIDKGHPVVLRHAYIYGKAGATDPLTGQLVNTYISNLVQIREQTWLNYAVFYNLDMEMHSGSAMDVNGPVHTNQNAYITSGAGVNLQFFDAFTTAKGVYRKYKYGGTVTHTGNVYFPPKDAPSSGELLTMSTSQDSAMSGFKTFAENRWNSFVQDSKFAVPFFNPPGLLPHIQDDYTTTSTDETRNNAYAMIEPQLASVSSDTAATNTYTGYKGDDVENQKFSALAGLTIRVKTVAGGPWPATWTTSLTNPGFELVYYTGATDPARPVNRSNLPTRDSSTKQPIEKIVPLNKMSAALLTKLNNAVKLVKYVEVTGGTAGNRALATNGTNSSTGGTTWSGIYDRRQGYILNGSTNNGLLGAQNTIQIDMGAFNTFLNAPAAEWTDTTDATKKVYNPDVSYSGVLYVQIPLIADSVSAVNARKTTDKVRPAVAATTAAAGYAVVLRNAKVLPTLPTNTNLRDDGLTVATNAPVYIMGSYNSDGLSATGSSSAPDTTNPATNTEVPALIAADAVTLLSAAYNDADMVASATTLNTATFTEVAAGIIAGIIPTKLNSSGVGTNDQWAGGVHNFVRFLENWSGVNYRYRGSVVCLYENEVSKGPWYQGLYSYWYNFPGRDVGYHAYFSGGRFPPGMPVIRTVRKISVADITAAQYTSGPPTPPAAGP